LRDDIGIMGVPFSGPIPRLSPRQNVYGFNVPFSYHTHANVTTDICYVFGFTNIQCAASIERPKVKSVFASEGGGSPSLTP